MRKTDTPAQLSDNPKKLMTELDELVHFLADGPEVQQEMRLPQDQIGSGESASDLDKVPVLTAAVDQEQAVEPDLKFGSELHSDLNQLVDDLVDQILPKLESELRRRLKTKISEFNS